MESDLPDDACTYRTTQAPWSSRERLPSRDGAGTVILAASGYWFTRAPTSWAVRCGDRGCSRPPNEEGNARSTVRRSGAAIDDGACVLHSGVSARAAGLGNEGSSFVSPLPGSPWSGGHAPVRKRRASRDAREGRRQMARLFGRREPACEPRGRHPSRTTTALRKGGGTPERIDSS